MPYTLRNKKTGQYYQRNNSRMYFDKNFFTTTENPYIATLFESLRAIEFALEAKLQFLDLGLNDKESKKIYKRLLKMSEEFEAIYFSDHTHITGPMIAGRDFDYNFHQKFKEIIEFQIINFNFNLSFAGYYFRLKQANRLKRFIISTNGLERNSIINLLGDSIEFDQEIPETSKNLMFTTNRKSDINLLKLCFEIKEIKMLDTKILNSLS